MDLLATIRIYLRVVERGTISGAARDLDMSQPSVSERIDKLERFLSTRLLIRSSRNLICTAEGRMFYEQGKHLLDVAEATINSVTSSIEQIQGRLRLAAPQCLGEVILPKTLMHARATYPELQIDLNLSDEIADPVTEGVDISLRLGRLNENGGYIAFPLGWVARKLVAAPSYLAAHGPIETPADLALHPFIRLKPVFANDLLPLARENGPTEEARIKTAMTTSHWRPMHELIVAGGGIGVLQHPACAQALAQGRLVELLDGYRVPPLALNALVPPLRPLPPRVRAVLDLLKQDIPERLEPALDIPASLASSGAE
ncbi:HTH-type transcriptional regulator DmlR [Achromobacter anxifer]|uniref:LysR family transcriptional regulator n=1 Tax=Achromobacter anxifer TaxID=1287737 RepID=UPI00155CB923|nr:LysR family transcriptional regulator [Achromobacter anxifer]CAB5517518.1 HTH-type transcriptional regulator DmlR [Achromobacter anxifer]